MKEIILDQDEGYMEKAVIEDDLITFESLEVNSLNEWYCSWSYTISIDDFKVIQKALEA